MSPRTFKSVQGDMGDKKKYNIYGLRQMVSVFSARHMSVMIKKKNGGIFHLGIHFGKWKRLVHTCQRGGYKG